ncbi:putative nucleotidyltransferase, ribonuclease H, partial [Tanacetum coccineum]
CGKYGHFENDCYSEKCYNCGKFGRIARDCYAEKKVEENMNLVTEEEIKDEFLLMANINTNIDSESIWYLNTGASNHMCGHKHLFKGLQAVKDGHVSFRDASKVQVKYQGAISFFKNDGTRGTIENEYFVPDLKSNILSLGQLMKRGYSVRMIWVVVDRLTKSAHFLPIRKNYGISKLAEIFRQEIVRLHGTPTSIMSDRDPKFTSRFWKGLQKAWGTRLKFSTTFHPQTDGQSERTIQTLEDMLRACALEWTGSWDEYLCLVEFAYNNSWHASIKAAPFELLYGRKCRAPICWDEVGERLIEGPELIEITNEKVAVAKEKLKEARSRQKSYADKHRRDLEFQVGDRVFLKVSPFRGVKRFGSNQWQGSFLDSIVRLRYWNVLERFRTSALPLRSYQARS